MIYVFIGPSLPLAEARQVLDAIYLPPVRQGDIYRLVSLRRPSAIVIIDGYFNQVPAVWHKEILWALQEGVRVFGASSMGALRAVELSAFGMQGVGRIFDAYRTGVFPPYVDEQFEDDDEVAVRHGPAELDYLSLSDALVNIRLTLAAAADAGIIGEGTRNRLVRLAKDLLYPRRSYKRLLAEARRSDLPETEISALESWLPEGRLDLKREDALHLLEVVGQCAGEPNAAQETTFSFQHTVQWQAAVEATMTCERAAPLLLDELRLDGPRYLLARREALEQLLAATTEDRERILSVAIRDRVDIAADARQDVALNALHHRPEEVDAHWHRELRQWELDRAVRSLPESIVERHLIRALWQSGDAAALGDRCRRKREILERLEFVPRAAELNGLQELQLHDWYFGRRLGQNIPEDLSAYVADLGFRDVTAFNQALLCEYVYLERESENSPS